jgi:hypothetical protein
MMPLDPFFSSANKKHYVENPEHAALMAKVRAMSEDERNKWVHETYYKPLQDRTNAERTVLKALRFEWNVRARSRRRFEAEQYAYDLRTAAARTHTVVMHGQNPGGGHRSQCQVSAHKASHNRQGAPRHFDHVYNPKHRKRHSNRDKP